MKRIPPGELTVRRIGRAREDVVARVLGIVAGAASVDGAADLLELYDFGGASAEAVNAAVEELLARGAIERRDGGFVLGKDQG